MRRGIAIEKVKAYGHPNVRATHRTTVEITKDNYLTTRGDCIIGINADKALKDFSEEFKQIVKKHSTLILVLLYIDNKLYDSIIGHGHPGLIYGNENKIIIRKSSFIDDATAAIHATKAARDLNRELISRLRREDTELHALFIAIDLSQLNPEHIFSRCIVEDTSNA